MSRLTRAMSPLPIEPEFDFAASAPARFPPPDYERLRTLLELYREQPRRRRPMRLLRHAALALAIFAVGAVIGLAAVWWATKGRMPPAADAGGFSATGISAGELPYDGADSVPPRPLAAVPQINLAELPYDGTGAGSKDDGLAAAGGATPAGKPGGKLPAASGGDANAATVAKRGEKNDAHAAVHERKTARTAQRYRSARHAAKGGSANEREIDRLRQQADEEMNKKPGRQRPGDARIDARPASGRAAAMKNLRPQHPQHESGKTARMRAQLARCERAANIIRREQCKWHLCSGRWGRNGCPAYAHSSPY